MTAVAEEPLVVGTATRPPRRFGRIVGWILVVIAVLGVAFVGIQLAGNRPDVRSGFDPEGRGPYGTKALAEILRQQGVRVDVVRDRTAVAAMLDDETTLVLADPYALSDDGVEELLRGATSTVVLTPSARMLRLLELGDYAWGGGGAVSASCALPEFARVGTITPGQLFTPDPGVNGCFAEEGVGAAVLVADDPGDRRALVDGSRLFTNEHLAEQGNAALGLALLGQRPHVVWYVPSFADSDASPIDPEASLGSLTPAWVTPAILLLFATAIAAGLWRGRRFGPLVAETLPVSVRASETMQGRARLVAKAADAPHAAAALRSGTASRIAARLGLASGSSADEVADAAADRIRVRRDAVRALLTGPLPATEPELIASARRLSELESAVDEAVRIERSTP